MSEIFYGRFKHVCLGEPGCNGIEDLIGFFDINDSREPEIQIIEQFERVFNGEYGKYGRSYVLRDFGKVEAGKGHSITELQYSKEELERLAEEAFDD